MGKKSPGGAFCGDEAPSQSVGAQKAWFLRAGGVGARQYWAPRRVLLDPGRWWAY